MELEDETHTSEPSRRELRAGFTITWYAAAQDVLHVPSKRRWHPLCCESDMSRTRVSCARKTPAVPEWLQSGFALYYNFDNAAL